MRACRFCRHPSFPPRSNSTAPKPCEHGRRASVQAARPPSHLLVVHQRHAVQIKLGEDCVAVHAAALRARGGRCTGVGHDGARVGLRGVDARMPRCTGAGPAVRPCNSLVVPGARGGGPGTVAPQTL